MIAPANSLDVLVVGGGLSGLVAAFEMQKQGLAVGVLDANDEPGGVIATRVRDGFLYETGANSALDTSPLLNEIFADVGVADARRDASAVANTRYVVRNGALVALPTSPGAFLATGAFTLAAKLRLFREPFVAPAPRQVEESIAAFVRRRLGNEFLDYAIDPFVSGIYAGDPEQISVPAAFPRLHALEQKYGSLIRGQIQGARERRKNPEKAKNAAKSFSFDRGMQVFPRALAARLAGYQAGVRVESIARRAAGGYEVRASRGGEAVAFSARAVVVAAPAHRAAGFVEPMSAPLARALEAIHYAPVAVVASAFRRDDVRHDLAGFGFLVPKKEGRRILGSLFSSSMFEGRAPAGHALLTTFVGGMRNPELTTAGDAELEATVERELAALVGAGRPMWHEIVRWAHAIPQYTIGHLDRIAAVDRASAAFPGLHWCANWRGGVSVSDCVKNGHAMAAAVRGSLAPSTPAARAA
jgi:oxygen-dependent protoporphyrinogen oxidase